MRVPHRTALLTLFLLLGSLGAARANLATDYVFMNGTGTPYDMAGAATLMISGDDDVWSSPQSIGFDFSLDGESFSHFFASTNGPLLLSTSTSQSFTYIYAYNSFNSVDCPHPVITAFFDDLVASGNGVRTILTGTAPNRVRVVDWEAYLWYGTGTDTEYHFQVRLYEGSNKIELWYGEMGTDQNDGNGQIGAALTTTNYISIAAGNPPSASGDVTINDLSRTPIAENTLYTLRPCQKNITIAGNTAQGGTATMANGDVLLTGARSRVGSSVDFQPFTIGMGEFPCGLTTYTYEIEGDAAGDYTITPEEGEIGSFQSFTPTLRFAPSDTGTREATLRVTDNKGFSRTYTLRGNGFRCVEWVGDPGQGGTAMLLDGDVLLDSYQVPIGSSQDYTPIRINQISTDGGCTSPVQVTYTLDDPTGNYAISPASEMIPVGGASVPTITFNAMNGVGFQEATLTVNADGEVRTFTLRDFVAAPGGEIRYAGTAIGPNTRLFRDRYSCVGSEVITLELDAVNIGTGDFVVRGLEGFLLDTTLRQGIPPYPLMTDEFGRYISTKEYFLSTTPGVAPRTPGDEFDSLIVPEGETRKLYLNIITERPGKRFGRIFIRTNAFNLNNPDVSGDMTQGLVFADMFARGLGGMLADAPGSDKRPHPVVFPNTKARESVTMTSSVFNTGDCDLKVNAKRLRFESGDVNEFEILNISGGTNNGEDYVLPPGDSLSVTVRFTPSRSGSRRATLRLVTNDSSLIIPHITARGVYQWEFFGVGTHDLETRNLDLPPAVIGGETSKGMVQVENTQLDQITVDSIAIVGGGNEILEDPDMPWPSVPLKINAGDRLDLSILFVPAADSDPGVREAEILLFLSNGDTARAKITGYAGTRTLMVAPLELFTNKQVPVGRQVRAFFTVTNTGTLPAVLTEVRITGTDSTFYAVAPLSRRVMEPGQTEFIEVTYIPGTQAAHSATAEVHSNAINGTQLVQLGGTGTGTVPVTGQDNATGTSREGAPLGRNEGGRHSAGSYTLQLTGVSPNPTTGRIAVTCTMPADGDATLELYSVDGHRVRTLHQGTIGAGEHQFGADLHDLPEGVYFVRLRSGETSIVKRISLVR